MRLRVSTRGHRRLRRLRDGAKCFRELRVHRSGNTIVKGVIACVGGGRDYATDIAKVLGGAMAGGLIVAVARALS